VTQLAAEIREAFAKIKRRYEGDHDAIAGIRVSHIKATESHIETLEARVSRCTCQEHAGFEINTDRTDARGYRALEQARIDRLLFDDGRAVL